MTFLLIDRIRVGRTLLAVVLGMILAISIPHFRSSLAIPVADVPNPRQSHGGWVVDMAEMLSPDSETQLNAMISKLEATNGAEIAVVTVPDTQPSGSPKAFATKLFNQWGLGKKGVDNGLLFLVSKGDRRTEVETGYAIEAVLPDAKVGNILRDQVTPNFKIGDFDTGIVSGTETIVGLLQAESFTPSSPLNVIGEFSSWLLKGAMGVVAAGVATLSLKGAKKELRLKPIGETKAKTLQHVGTVLLTGVNWLAGDGDFWGKEKQPQTASLAHNPNLTLIQTWWKVFWICLIAGIALKGLLGSAIAFLLLAALIWLGVEIGWHAKSEPDSTPSKYPIGKLILVGALGLCSSLFGFSIFGTLFWVLLGAIYAAFAGALKFKRSLSEPKILCKKCDLPLEMLEEDTLRSQLTKAQNTTWTIRSTLYEGWRCPSCSVEKAKQGLDLHLFSQVVFPQRFDYCRDCQALTLSRTSEVVYPATTYSAGERLIKTYCACCEKETQKTQSIPRKSSSSSYSSSSSDYSSSYSSSDSGSSSDFGGGSSGGGGAGDSW